MSLSLCVAVGGLLLAATVLWRLVSRGDAPAAAAWAAWETLLAFLLWLAVPTAVFLAHRAALDEPEERLAFVRVLASAVGSLSVALAACLLARLAAGRDWRGRLAGPRMRAGRLLRWGVGGGVLSIGGAIAISQLLAAARGSPVDDSRHPVVVALGGTSALRQAFVVAYVVALAPLSEEILFRRLLQGGLSRFLPGAAAVGCAAGAFAAMHHAHPEAPWNLPAMLWIGTVLGVVFRRTGSLTAAWIAHGANNAAAIAWASFQA